MRNWVLSYIFYFLFLILYSFFSFYDIVIRSNNIIRTRPLNEFDMDRKGITLEIENPIGILKLKMRSFLKKRDLRLSHRTVLSAEVDCSFVHVNALAWYDGQVLVPFGCTWASAVQSLWRRSHRVTSTIFINLQLIWRENSSVFDSLKGATAVPQLPLPLGLTPAPNLHSRPHKEDQLERLKDQRLSLQHIPRYPTTRLKTLWLEMRLIWRPKSRLAHSTGWRFTWTFEANSPIFVERQTPTLIVNNTSYLRGPKIDYTSHR